MFKFTIFFCLFSLINNAPLEKNCPIENGRYPTSYCNIYVECVNGYGGEKQCPSGLVYNLAESLNAYPCGYPSQVSCDRRNGAQQNLWPDQCYQNGYFKSSNLSNCGEYIKCTNGVKQVYQCQFGLAFDESTTSCKYPEYVPSCDVENYFGFACPEYNSVENKKLYPHPTNSSLYFSCPFGRPRLNACQSTCQTFNVTTQNCEEPPVLILPEKDKCEIIPRSALSVIFVGQHDEGTLKFAS